MGRKNAKKNKTNSNPNKKWKQKTREMGKETKEKHVVRSVQDAAPHQLLRRIVKNKPSFWLHLDIDCIELHQDSVLFFPFSIFNFPTSSSSSSSFTIHPGVCSSYLFVGGSIELPVATPAAAAAAGNAIADRGRATGRPGRPVPGAGHRAPLTGDVVDDDFISELILIIIIISWWW